MTTQDHYIGEFSRLQKERPPRQPAWLALVRKAALDRFVELGFPTLDDEEWKYTSVAPIAKTSFRLGTESKVPGLKVDQLERITFGEMECSYLVFLNGRFAPELSRIRPLPEGVRVGSLATALAEEPSRVEPHLSRHAAFETQAFVSLNTAFLQDGAFVHLSRRKVMEEPIHLIYVTAPNGSPWHPTRAT